MSEPDLILAREVSVGTQQFAATFLRAQSAREAVPRQFDAVVASDRTGTEAIATAFAIARTEMWLDDLCTQCVTDRIVTREFVTQAAQQTAAPGLIAVQARIDPLSRFRDTLLEANGLIRVADFVCRILVDGAHRGTGFLVRSDVVMTAGHVLTPNHPGDAPIVGPGGAAEPDSADRIEILFDDKIEIIAGRRRRSKPRRFGVAKNWLIACSAPDIGPGSVASSLVPDYALIQLDSAPLFLPGGLDLADQEPFSADPLLIVQHPDGRPISHAEGNVDHPDPATRFFTHSVNAEGGSSGAPCFSVDFKVVGLHNGAVLNSAPRRNNALSITVPAAVLAKVPLAAAPVRYLSRMTLENAQLRLVVGRQETQDWLRASLAGRGSRILAIPPTPERKTGMSFTADLIAALLPQDQHRVIRLSAEQFRNDDPPSFARRMFAAAGAPITLSLNDTPDPNTTLEGWLRRVFVPGIMDQLNGLRGGRMVWLILDDLRLTLADGNGLRECLDLIYAGVVDRPWFRVVLLGYGATPSPDIADHFGRVDLPPISPGLIKAAFETRLNTLTDAAQVATIRATFQSLWNMVVKDDTAAENLDGAANVVAPFLLAVP